MTTPNTLLMAGVAKLPAPLKESLEDELAKSWVVLLLIALALLSAIPLASVIGWGYTLLAAAGVVLLVWLASTGWSKYLTALVVVLGAIVLPWLSLIAVSYVIDLIPGDDQLDLWVSLVLAGVVFAAAAFAYLHVWRERWLAAAIVALLLAVANVVGVPLLVASGKNESSTVVASQPYVSKLDLAIVVPGGSATELAGGDPIAPGRDWDVQWSVARAGGDGPEWLLLDSVDPGAALAAARGSGEPLPGEPAWRGGADRAVLLNVDGTPPVVEDPAALPSVARSRGEIARWLALAERLPSGTQLAVLLQTTDAARVAAWRRRVEAAGGVVATVQELGTRSLTDAAQVLAVQAPGASAELALARKHRPILLFDGAERQPSPLDVDDLFASRRVSLCRDDGLDGGDCRLVLRAADLENGSTHLKIRLSGRDDRPVASAIYVHPTTRTVGGRRLLFLDYWWFLDDNPALIGKGTTCGVGLAMPGITCFDHPADWEGMTVVLDVGGETATPIAAQYAEHKDVVRYDWGELQARWARLRADPRSALSAALRRNLAAIEDAADRPVAFVGLGTHATYAHSCTRRRCRQTLTGTPENRYDGEESWAGNVTATCVETDCVRLLPTRHRGADAALWNAYEGVWGDRKCILGGAYCTSELSPAAPSTQGRYRRPERIAGWVDGDVRPHRCGADKVACATFAR